jgi:hypothetical protein
MKTASTCRRSQGGSGRIRRSQGEAGRSFVNNSPYHYAIELSRSSWPRPSRQMVDRPPTREVSRSGLPAWLPERDRAYLAHSRFLSLLKVKAPACELTPARSPVRAKPSIGSRARRSPAENARAGRVTSFSLGLVRSALGIMKDRLTVVQALASPDRPSAISVRGRLRDRCSRGGLPRRSGGGCRFPRRSCGIREAPFPRRGEAW